MRNNQIFKHAVPNDLFFSFLKENCTSTHNNFFVFDIDSFKKAKFHGRIQMFCQKLYDFYYPVKYEYISRDNNFTRFMTIIRQICNYNNIPFTTRIKYANNTYYITYFIKNTLVETSILQSPISKKKSANNSASSSTVSTPMKKSDSSNSMSFKLDHNQHF